MYKSINNGKIIFKLDSLMKAKKLSKNKLSNMSGVRFDTILRYCRGDITRIDLETICKLCDTLNCKIEDIIEYKK